ncbi:MAG: transcriptional regulator [Citrobacter freundii]|nr:MAG: transcriptional regulator [Citrobacter freundii]
MKRIVPENQLNRIKEILKEQGRSQAWLADKVEKSYVVVTNYCNNNTQPSLEILRKIAGILDVDVRELLVSTKEKANG